MQPVLGGHVGGQRPEVVLGQQLPGEEPRPDKGRRGQDRRPPVPLPPLPPQPPQPQRRRRRRGVRAHRLSSLSRPVRSYASFLRLAALLSWFSLTKNQLSNTPAPVPVPDVHGPAPDGGVAQKSGSWCTGCTAGQQRDAPADVGPVHRPAAAVEDERGPDGDQYPVTVPAGSHGRSGASEGGG